MKVWPPVAEALVLIIDGWLECIAIDSKHRCDPGGDLKFWVKGTLQFFELCPRGFNLQVGNPEVGVLLENPLDAGVLIKRRWSRR